MLEVTEERIVHVADFYAGRTTEDLVKLLDSMRLDCESEGINPLYDKQMSIEILGILKAISRNRKTVDFGGNLVAWLTKFVRERKGKMEDAGKPISIW